MLRRVGGGAGPHQAGAADLPAVQGGADRGPRTGLAPTATRLAHGTRAPDCTCCGGLGVSSLVLGKLLQ